MAIVTTDNAHYRDIANAIRAKGVAGTRRPEDMAAGVLAIPAAPAPEVGFVPSEWNEQGYVTKGRWYGTVIPDGAFAGQSATYAAFRYLSELEHEGITTLGLYAFHGCASLTAVDFPQVTSIPEYGFGSCTGLTDISIPLASFVDARAFYGCSKLASISSSVIVSVGIYSFSGCVSLASVHLPRLSSLKQSVFDGCTSLVEIELPNVTSIGPFAFRGCSKLEKIVFPLVRSIEGRAFSSCSKLTALILRGTSVCTISSTNVFESTPIASGTGYVYVPAALVDTYKTATNWATYANQIRAIEDYPEITGGAA